MNTIDRYRTFAFVDRITEIEPGRRARGCFTVPATLHEFPACLVAEAIGQLAAWLAMAFDDFRHRPVAALAGEARVLGVAAPGHVIHLTVDADCCDRDRVAYSGRAQMRDAPLLELRRCLGAMLPLAEFDDPEAVRAHFATLTGPGAQPGGFPGCPPPHLETIAHTAGTRLRAVLHVPTDAPFFADHFPRRPVFPATLLLDAQIRLALDLAAEALAAPVATLLPSRITGLKQRAFIAPGQRVEIDVEQRAALTDGVTFSLRSAVDGKRTSSASVEIVRRADA